jgi:hypothetical protein
MIRTTHTLNRLAQGIAAAIAVAVLIAPAGFAGTSARYGAHDPWFTNAVSRAQPSAPDPWFTNAVSRTQLRAPDPWFNYAVSLSTRTNTANHSGYRFTTDTLGGNARPKATPGYRFITDTLGSNSQPKPTSGYRFITDTLAPGSSNPPATALVSTGFDWGDAGVGAAATLGLVLLMLTGSLMLRRRGRLAF